MSEPRRKRPCSVRFHTKTARSPYLQPPHVRRRLKLVISLQAFQRQQRVAVQVDDDADRGDEARHADYPSWPKSEGMLHDLGGETNGLRLNKIKQHCHSTEHTQFTSGQSHCLIESPIILHLCITCPSDMFVSFVFKHIHAANIYTIMCKSFVPVMSFVLTSSF